MPPPDTTVHHCRNGVEIWTKRTAQGEVMMDLVRPKRGDLYFGIFTPEQARQLAADLIAKADGTG